jgi:hypothetical protein
MSDLICHFSDRRAAVRRACELTGIDEVAYLRYADDEGSDQSQPTRPRLRVRLLGDVLPGMLKPKSWLLEGGRRVRDLRVRAVASVADPEGDSMLELDLDLEGDASTYLLRVVRDRDRDLTAPDGVDPRYDRASFSFKVDCPALLDCADGGCACPEGEAGQGPLLDYTAKDYASFRQLLLERLSLVLPAWKERHIPDIGITLVELMAYVGDHLSYRQDVVATEAYLETSRLRRSIRRHARLVDYAMHEGANPRAWVTVCSAADDRWRADDVEFYTRVPGWAGAVSRETAARAAAEGVSFEVFLPIKEALADGEHIVIKAALGRIPFYTWGGEECCLPRGATSATLQINPEGDCPPLSPGDVLILEEVLGPDTGRPEHADPSHRHAVRLTSVTCTHDPLVHQTSPNVPAGARLYDVTWMAEDALPFPLRLSSLDPTDAEHPCKPVRDVSVARGNVVLVDHGRRVQDELGPVEGAAPVPTCDAPDRPSFHEERAAPFRPTLSRQPLTYRAPLPQWNVLDGQLRWTAVPPPASAMLSQDPRAALPDLVLDGKAHASVPARTWTPRRDLLDSSADDPHLVVEMDDGGVAHLRFGDGVNGLAPEAGTQMTARYRVGNGPAGNVASEAIAHVSVVGGTRGQVSVRNPLPAAGGQAPESADDVRLLAPALLRTRRERAVIAEDYAELAQRDHPALQGAAAALRWTGSWYEVRVGLDPLGREPASPTLCATVERDLERYRRIGHDLRVEIAQYVPVRLSLFVCARPEYLRSHVRAGVLDALVGADGFFDPDRFTFGQILALSAVVAAVQAVPGVLDVTPLRMERLFEGDQGELSTGELPVGPLEIVQLENDPAMPEHGILRLEIGGGR